MFGVVISVMFAIFAVSRLYNVDIDCSLDLERVLRIL